MTDKNKSRIHRRGDHWSPLFKLFKLFPSINHQPKLIANSALFGKESCQRSWLRDWKTFYLYTIFGCRFEYKLGCLTKVNPSGFLAKTTSLCTREAMSVIFGVDICSRNLMQTGCLTPPQTVNAASGHAGKTVHRTVFFFRLSLRFRSVHQLHLD